MDDLEKKPKQYKNKDLAKQRNKILGKLSTKTGVYYYMYHLTCVGVCMCACLFSHVYVFLVSIWFLFYQRL